MSGYARITRYEKRTLQRLRREMPGRLDAAGRGMVQAMTDDVVMSFGTSPPGRQYEVGQGVVHVASVAGFPPNVDTGTLRASMGWSPSGRLQWWVHDGTDYGIHLEFGTQEIAARPFVAPVFEEWRSRRAREFLRNAGVFDV